MKRIKTRLQFIRQHYPEILLVSPEKCEAFVRANSDHGGADVVLEVAGGGSYLPSGLGMRETQWSGDGGCSL